MRVRTVLAGSTAAVLAAVALPGVAQAAPVVPARAVLAAHEFPIGTTGYAVENETIRTTDDINGPTHTECDRRLVAGAKAIDGALASTAKVARGAVRVESAVVARSFTAEVSALTAACDAESSPHSRTVVLPAPADLARYRTFLTQYAGTSFQGWVDVHGATVTVDVMSSSDSGARDLFWQVLRAQVAKVERQP
ncbi:hypothetical protein ACXYTP_02210 [Tsukamurella ocularis]|uniref:hypothetical protein n=1 Tax=Tsukamurella ocularis TaxID=1970234 RepID=UPI0039F01AA8